MNSKYDIAVDSTILIIDIHLDIIREFLIGLGVPYKVDNKEQ